VSPSRPAKGAKRGTGSRGSKPAKGTGGARSAKGTKGAKGAKGAPGARGAKRTPAPKGGARAGAARATSRDGASGGARSSGGRAAVSKSGKPLSKAAEKAIESRRARHAAASVRKADRPGASATRSAPARGERPAGRPDRRGGRTDRGLGGDQVEGRHAVRELLIAGRRRVREVWVVEDLDDAQMVDDIAELALNDGVPVREVSRKKLFSVARTESPQGVLAYAEALPEHDIDDLVEQRPGQPVPFLLAVDGVTDPGNLGALLRSAECAGVNGVVLPRHRAVHVTPTVTKAAAGAVEYLPMTLVGGLPAAITRMQRAGIWVVGLDASGDQPVFDLALGTEPVCLVLGAEGAGLSRLVRQRCDALASIPLLGNLASLNVAAAGALACFEIARRRRDS
jgi:23S rRNA (guanosine2251-2'-O)-methyltransferase